MNTANNSIDAIISELQATGENISVTKQEVIEKYLNSLDQQGVKRPLDPQTDLEEKGALFMKAMVYTAFAYKVLYKVKEMHRQAAALSAEAISYLDTAVAILKTCPTNINKN